jgi:hypothetical protein
MKKILLFDIFNRFIINDGRGVYYDKDNNQYQFLKEYRKFKLLDIISPLKLIDKYYKNTGRDMHCEYNNKIILFNKNENYSNHKFLPKKKFIKINKT